MEFLFKQGKYEQCLENIDKHLRSSSLSVCTQLLMQNDALACKYMLSQKKGQTVIEDFKQLLIKAASLPPGDKICSLELVLLYNYIYVDILISSDHVSSNSFILSYTQAARVFFRVYSVLQPLAYSELRKDLPTDAQACCNILVQRCFDCLPFNPDISFLAPVCNVITLLAVINFRGNNWVQAIQLLSSVKSSVENWGSDIPESPNSGYLLPLHLDDSPEFTSPLDWVNFLLGLALFQSKQWKQSRETLQIVKNDRLLSWASYLIGFCWMNEREFTEAVSVSQRIKTARVVPVRLKAKLLNLLGDCFGKLGKPQLSIQMYKEALSVDFGYMLPLYNISLKYQQLGTADVELECLNLLVTSLESDMSSDTLETNNQSFISLLDHISTNDDNISYATALYKLAKRCLQLKHFDVAAQKYQDLIAFLIDWKKQLKMYKNIHLPSLKKIHHEAILALLKAEKYEDCLALCDKVIRCYQKDRDCFLDVSIDNSQMSQNITEIGNEESHNFFNNNNLNNSAADISLSDRVCMGNINNTQNLKRKRQTSDSDPNPCVIERKCSDEDDTHDYMDLESREFNQLNKDVIALKYKAEVLEKMDENSSAIVSLESAVECISMHRKIALQKNIQKGSENPDNLDEPVAKRQRLSSEGDACQKSVGETTSTRSEPLIQFEAELYQSLAAILSSQGQYSDALHYYRLSAQLLPDSTKIHYLCTKTLLSMNCPKVASSNWLRHRKLPHLSSLQVSAEVAKKQENGSEGTTPEEMDYNQLDLQCLTLLQQFLKDSR